MVGDILARGGKSAVFPSLSHVSQDKWNAAFNILKKPAKKNGPKANSGTSPKSSS